MDLPSYQPSGGQQDTYIQRFYEKLSETFSSWIPLEDVYYRNNEHGEIDFGKVTEITKWPDLGFFNIAIAKNGGPVAFMLQDNVLMIGGLKDIKSLIFVFSSFGKLLSVINVLKYILLNFKYQIAQKLNISAEKLKWQCFEFTADEDLLMITNEGYLYLVDPKTGELKEKPVLLHNDLAQRPVVDAKLFDNILVFRNSINQFYWVPNIQQSLVANKFDYVQRLADAQITDYIIIPKGIKGASALELLIPDPEEGFHVIKENKGNSLHLRDLSEFSDDKRPFGKISYMALNSKKDLLAIYAEAETRGRIIVMKSNYSREFNRFDTKLLEAKALDWCGNDAPVLTYPDKIVLVGPNQFEILDMKTKTAGIKCMNELDGLRIVTSEKTYFLERVQQVLLKTFKIASISPSAKLLNAIKSVDLNIPRADEIIRELGKDLTTGIEDLLEAATYEHQNITVLKHLLRTASFAKTFVDATEYDSNKYVTIVKHMIVLTKLRNSQSCGRAITYKQFEKFKAKNILKLLLKFRDYKLALQLVEHLNLKQYASQVYEDWCQTMVKYSSMTDAELEIRLQEKFDQLKIQIAEDQGINTSALGFNMGNINQFSQGGRSASVMPNMNQNAIISQQLGNNIKLNIDFTKLAKIADSKGRKRLANFLISKEKSIVKKIPFLLEAQQYEEALGFAMEGGDPNIINKVFTEILRKHEGNYKVAIQKASTIPDGLRHLRNFAKTRKDEQLLAEIALIGGAKYSDYSSVVAQLKNAYESESVEFRLDNLRGAFSKLNDVVKDEFYSKIIEEMSIVTDKQRNTFKQTKDQRIFDSPLSDYIAYFINGGKDQEKEVKDLKNSLKLQEKYYYMMAIRGFAKAGNWEDVSYFINMKKPPIAYSFLAELCIEHGKVPLAVEAIKKISDYDEKIPMLIDISQWRDAIEETFQSKRMEYLDEIRQKGPSFVEDFIREEQVKRNLSKHIMKIKSKGGRLSQGPKKSQGGNRNKVGEATAKKMQQKATEGRQQGKGKGKKEAEDEEIDSDIGDDVDMEERIEKKKGNALKNDPFFVQDAEDQNETVEERRLRMTKNLLEELNQQNTFSDPTQKEDFFENLYHKTDAEAEIFAKDDDMLAKRLKYQILERKGKLFYNIADDYVNGDFDRVFLKGHKKAITALEWNNDNKSVFTASKDCCLIQWDLDSQKKLIFKGEKHNRSIEGHFDEPLCMAVSPNGKYLVSGGKDRIVRIWDIQNQKQIQTFIGHRDSITGIKFDRENDQFYTVSNDRSLKVWNIREMAYMDSHYGHQSDILGLDSFAADRLISCGLDRHVIFWKINEDSELLYKNEKHTADTINVINSQYFFTSSIDNCLDLWIMNKKRPIFTLPEPHTKDSWILSAANVRNSDLMCSGSYDGQVVFYKLNKEERKIEIIKRLDGLSGCLNNIKFSNIKGNEFQNVMMAVSHSKEERLGRWHVQSKVKNGITILRKEGKFPGGFFIYYEYQGHINSALSFHQILQKEIKDVDFSKLCPLTISYDDPFNLKDPRTYRASMGYFMKQDDKALYEKFKKLDYKWTHLPDCRALVGQFPYRNKTSMTFGATRFLPACLTYMLRNKRAMKDMQKDFDKKSGTIELIENGMIKYFMPLDKRQEFYLTQIKTPEVKDDNKYTSIYYKKNQ